MVDWCVAHRRVVVAATVALFVLSIALFRFVPQQFFPASDRPELMVDLWLPQGASYAATEREVHAMEAALAGNEDVASITAYVGVGSPRFYLPLDQQTPNINFGQFVVMTKRRRESRARADSYPESVRARLPGGARPRHATGERPAGGLSGAVPREWAG